MRLHAVILVLLLAAAARAQDFVKSSLPGRWLDPYVPEDLPGLDLPDYVKNDPLELAGAQAFAGRYKLALLTLGQPNKDDAQAVALLRARCLADIGERARALAILGAKPLADEPRAQVERAVVLADEGKAAQAIALLNDLLKRQPDSIAAHYQLGRISEDAGDLATARRAYGFFEPFVDQWQGRGAKAFDSAEDVTCIGRALDRWATLNSLYQTRSALHQVILSMFVKAYDEIDRGYWPAHVAAAEYYLSHDDPQSAMLEMRQAQAGNPRDMHALEVLGAMALESYNFDAADKLVATMRQIDPDAIPAELLSARNLLLQRRARDAEAPIRRVLQRQPQHLEALGLLAAVYALQLQDDKTADVLKQINALYPFDATAYFEVAEQLGAMRQYPRSAAMYKIAVDRAPWWTSARNGLGLLYTQSGDEDAAQTVLEAAHTLDPYNHATTNYLRLLEDLRKFARKETAHFIVMYDATKDPIIPEYFADYLETIYPQVCGEFRHEPAVKTYIEVFPTHDAFSVRTTGSPWIGTVGASTGRVIALVSPRTGLNTMGPFNWAQVLRHEFTHTVTLSMTDNRIAHWLTEGLAVEEEGVPLRWEWIPMLYQAVTTHSLFTMEGLTWGFVRPRRPMDRQLAYAQSFWICQYIEATWGHDAMLKMLDLFRQGQDQEQVFSAVLGRSENDFQEQFFAWTQKQVAGWGYDAKTTQKYNELRKLGQTQIESRQYAAATATWEQIAALRPVDPLPQQRLAGLYLSKDVNQPLKAIDHLIVLHRLSLHDNLYAKRIARIYRDLGDLPNAVKYAMSAVYIDPYDPGAHELLAALDEKTGDAAGLAREKRVMDVLQKWIEQNRRENSLDNN